MFDNPVELMIRVPVILLALTVHECAHAYFAYRMGDPTAYRMGRVSLNPLRHLDVLGTICLLFAPIGWAKPVPINPLNFSDRRRGILVSTAAGPVSNLAQALVWALLLRAVLYGAEALVGAGPRGADLLSVLWMLCFLGVLINTALAVFNCLPLYPLDGFHITYQLLGPAAQERFGKTASVGPFILLGLVLLSSRSEVSFLSRLILPPARFLLRYVAGAGD